MSFSLPIEPILAAVVVLIRVSFLIGFMPALGDGFSPVRVRIVFAIALTMLLAPLGLPAITALPRSLPALGLAMVPEALIGATLGLLGRMMFAAVQIAGSLAGHEMGFSMASEIDPMSNLPDAVIAQLQYALAMMIFFFTDAHALFLHALSESFRVIPPFGAHFSESVFSLIRAASVQMFYLGVKINFPVLATLLCVNVTFAMLAKAVPGLNVMIESFPIRIMAGLIVLTLTLSFLGVILRQSFGSLDAQLAQALKALAP